MTTNTWHYIQNQFDNATKGNYKRMNTLNADHIAKLQAQQADPDIATLLIRTQPLHDDYNYTYSGWLAAKGVYKGETDRMDNYIEELSSTKIKQWDIQIQQQYMRGTPDYTVILPNGRKPFQKKGTIEDTISHVQALAQRLGNYPALVAVKNDVLAFYSTITAARDLQQQKEELLDNASDLVEIARKDLAQMMYKNLGVLMNKYASTPNFITNFWEISLITTTGGAEPTPTPPAPAEKIIITMSTVQNPADKVTLGFKGEAGKLVNTAFGDGNIKSITMDGINYVLVGNTYLNNGQYTIASEVEIATLDGIVVAGIFLTAVLHPDGLDAEEYDYSNNDLTSIFFLPTNTRAKKIDVSGNNLDQQSMDTMMMTANGWGTDNGYIKADGGTNATLSGQGIAAKNQLIARGWSIQTN